MVRRWISENTNCFSLGHKELLIPPRCPSGWTCVLGTCLGLWPIGSEGLYSTPRALSVVKSPQKKWGKQSSRICIESVMPEPSRASLMVDMFPKWPRDQSENESQNTTSAKSCFKMQPELPWWLSGKKKKKICLPIHETQFLALIWEDPTSPGASKLGHHNHWPVL